MYILSLYSSAGPKDWKCTHCSYYNFARRAGCLKCGRWRRTGVRPEPALTEGVEPAPVPLSAGQKGGGFARGLFTREIVLVQKLPSAANEDSVWYSLAPFAVVKVS